MESKIFLNRKKKAIGLIHKIYLLQLKNRKSYTANTKTKSEVRGGGRKPWRQKGTGQARAGSSRSPLWVGGGVSFGPKPRIVHKKINKKERRLAILSAIYLKKKHFKFFEDSFFENLNVSKTKDVLKLLSTNQIDYSQKILIIVPEQNKNIWLTTRNIPNICVTTPNCLCLDHLLNSNSIILSQKSFESIQFIYGKSYYGKE
jgi:large subunit ribosomal protein L4